MYLLTHGLAIAPGSCLFKQVFANFSVLLWASCVSPLGFLCRSPKPFDVFIATLPLVQFEKQIWQDRMQVVAARSFRKPFRFAFTQELVNLFLLPVEPSKNEGPLGFGFWRPIEASDVFELH